MLQISVHKTIRLDCWLQYARLGDMITVMPLCHSKGFIWPSIGTVTVNQHQYQDSFFNATKQIITLFHLLPLNTKLIVTLISSVPKLLPWCLAGLKGWFVAWKRVPAWHVCARLSQCHYSDSIFNSKGAHNEFWRSKWISAMRGPHNF